MRELAARAGVAVVGIDYALSPEVRYPVALEQVVDVVRWLQANGDNHGLDASRLALGGDSAGGNLTTGALLQLRDLGEGHRIAAAVNYYAGYSPDCSPHSRRRYGTDADMLTAAEVDTFWNQYISQPADRNDPYTHGLIADVEGLPPFFIGVGECDILAEQNLAMAGKLLAAGVGVEVKLYPGAPHSFIEAVAVSSTARQALEDGAAHRDEGGADAREVALGIEGRAQGHAANPMLLVAQQGHGGDQRDQAEGQGAEQDQVLRRGVQGPGDL
jgi:acetyl esterase/lipase